MIYTPHIYQDHATQHIIDNPAAGLFLDMGLGKTVSTLTAINELMFDYCEISKVLVIAPLRVARDTWRDEVNKWDHLQGLRLSIILGSEKQRKEALKAKADVYIINRENVAWLVTHLGGAWMFDMVVIDELSSFKSSKATRFKALRRVRPLMKRVVGLTGTPAPNGLIDLWPQLYLLDQGQRLGKTITGYREAYFKQPYRVNGRPISGYKILEPSEQEISDKIKDICISMKAEDWLKIPERVDTVNQITLSPELMKQYKEFEKKQVLALDDREDISAFNAAGLANKLLQFANGAIYVDDKHNYVEIHNEKIEALGEAVEAANGNPMLVAYSFKSDLVRIMKHLKHLKPRLLDSSADMSDWKRGKISFGLGHSQSLGHGLNLQDGGNLMAWFGLNYNLENYLQFIKRLHRQGQMKSVLNQRLLCKGTMDDNVLISLGDKDDCQEAFLRSVKALIKQYRQ